MAFSDGQLGEVIKQLVGGTLEGFGILLECHSQKLLFSAIKMQFCDFITGGRLWFAWVQCPVDPIHFEMLNRDRFSEFLKQGLHCQLKVNQ